MTIGKRFIITSGALVILSSALAVVAILGLNGISRDAEQLNAQSEALKTIVFRLNSMVGGNLAVSI